MQILLSEAAYARVSNAAALQGADVLTIDPQGVVKRQGAAIEDADPEVFWISQDLYKSGQLPMFFGRMLRGANGRWAQGFSAGIDDPVFKRLMEKGVRLTRSSAQAPAIAEYVMCQALSLLHPIAAFRQAQAEGDWAYRYFREIGSTRWTLVGFGSIGAEIAKRLHPFGAELTIVRRNVAPEPLAFDVRHTSEILTTLPEADVVVLACALNDQTRGMADKAFFDAMKPGSLLINVGRGGLVDEAALRAGLDHDKPAAAVLDVVQTEPLPADSWMWNHPKVQITPHCSGAGDGVMGRADAFFLENLRRYRCGAALLNEASRSEVGLAE